MTPYTITFADGYTVVKEVGYHDEALGWANQHNHRHSRGGVVRVDPPARLNAPNPINRHATEEEIDRKMGRDPNRARVPAKNPI